MNVLVLQFNGILSNFEKEKVKNDVDEMIKKVL